MYELYAQGVVVSRYDRPDRKVCALRIENSEAPDRDGCCGWVLRTIFGRAWFWDFVLGAWVLPGDGPLAENTAILAPEHVALALLLAVGPKS